LPDDIKSDAPVLAMYGKMDSPFLSNAYVIAEDQKIWSLDATSITKAVALLLGVYYVFNRHYPPASRNLYDFVEAAILRNGTTNTTKKFLSFMKRFKGKT
jgi:hypothetical protein